MEEENEKNQLTIYEKLIDLYSKKTLNEFLTEQPLTTTESYRFDILDVRNEEKKAFYAGCKLCEDEEMIDRRKAPWECNKK